MRLTREGTRILQKYQVAEKAAEFEAKAPPPKRSTMHGGWPVTSEPIDWKPLELCSLSIRRAIDEVANVEDIDNEDHRVWVSENRAWLFEQFELKDEPPTLQDLEEFKLKRTKQELLNKITQLEREQKGLPPDDTGLTPEHKAEVRKAFGLPAKEPPKPNPFWVAENYVRTKLDNKQNRVEQFTQLVREQEDLPPGDPRREYQLETRRALGLPDNKPVPPPPPEPPFTEEEKAAIRAEVEADAKRKGIPLPKPDPLFMPIGAAVREISKAHGIAPDKNREFERKDKEAEQHTAEVGRLIDPCHDNPMSYYAHTVINEKARTAQNDKGRSMGILSAIGAFIGLFFFCIIFKANLSFVFVAGLSAFIGFGVWACTHVSADQKHESDSYIHEKMR